MMGDLPAARARVRRVDMPAADLLAITLALDGSVETLVVDLGRAGAGLVPERPRGQAAGAFVRKLRKELGGARVEGFWTEGATTRLRLRRGEAMHTLLWEPGGNLVLLDGDERVTVAHHPGPLRTRGSGPGRPYVPPGIDRSATEVPPTDLASLRAAGPRVLARRDAGTLERTRTSLRRALRRARTRVQRKVEAIERDAQRAIDAPRLRADANLILANLHRIGPRDGALAATDWELDPPAERSIDLDPALDPRQLADTLFRRARRLERGATIAADRCRAAAQERDRLGELEQRTEQATNPEELMAIAREAADQGVRGALDSVGPTRSRRREPARRRPYRRFVGHADRPILVGRGAADNDALTLHHARPQDLWLHARGNRGAHVIVPLDRGEACPPELLADAATLAAHFSGSREDAAVEVQYTPRRFVRKPRGAPPGAVLVDREKVFLVRMETSRVARLLDRERD